VTCGLAIVFRTKAYAAETSKISTKLHGNVSTCPT
jgi:hypothetical protein